MADMVAQLVSETGQRLHVGCSQWWEALSLDIDAALLTAATQHQHLASSTVRGSGSAYASEEFQQLGCLSEGLGTDTVLEDFVAGLTAAATAGIALDDSPVQANAAAEGATSAALATDLAVPVLGPGLLQELPFSGNQRAVSD